MSPCIAAFLWHSDSLKTQRTLIIKARTMA